VRAVELGEGTTAVTTRSRLPGVGYLNINSFVLDGPEPVLIDTQVASGRTAFLAALGEILDPADLRWIAITHTDADHIGNLAAVLDLAPNATLVTNYTGFIKLSTHSPVDPKRVRLVKSGDTIDLGDRSITVQRPPLYDAPETLAWFDHASRTLFAADCFGAIEPETHREQAVLSHDEVAAAMALWVAIDTPWAHIVDRDLFRESVGILEGLEPVSIRSGHLPLTVDDPGRLFASLLASPDGAEFDGIGHQDLLALLS